VIGSLLLSEISFQNTFYLQGHIYGTFRLAAPHNMSVDKTLSNRHKLRRTDYTSIHAYPINVASPYNITFTC
jgi:hypothetical protein